MLSRLVFGLFVCAVLLCSANAQAQPGGGGPGGRGGFMGGGMSSSMLLMNEKVREELDLVEDQVKALEELQEKSREKMTELFQDMRNGGGGDRQQAFEELRPKMEAMNKELEQDVDEILLPDQRKRLKQLTNQMRVRGRSGAGTGLLDNEELKKELEITSEQEEKMRAEAEKAQTMLREETAKLQKKAMDKVLEVLSADQRKKYEDLVGDQFDFGQNQFGGGRGGPGGGGRGGRDSKGGGD
ncbi:MAG: hypothetical protein ABL888_08365 [Pirellulaceae bacterium]